MFNICVKCSGEFKPLRQKSKQTCPACVKQNRIDKDKKHEAEMKAKTPKMEGAIKRKCLRCECVFQSEGIHNRMCDTCKRRT